MTVSFNPVNSTNQTNYAAANRNKQQLGFGMKITMEPNLAIKIPDSHLQKMVEYCNGVTNKYPSASAHLFPRGGDTFGVNVSNTFLGIETKADNLLPEQSNQAFTASAAEAVKYLESLTDKVAARFNLKAQPVIEQNPHIFVKDLSTEAKTPTT